MKLPHTTPVSKFEIRVPVWGGRKVGLASHKVGQHNSIEILVEDKDGNRIYPHAMYMAGEKLRTYPTEPVRRNPHIKLYIVPISDLEPLERA